MQDQPSQPSSGASKTAQWRRKTAKQALLRQPDASISQIAALTGISARTVASARAELVAAGLLPAGRSGPPVLKVATPLEGSLMPAASPGTSDPEPHPAGSAGPTVGSPAPLLTSPEMKAIAEGAISPSDLDLDLDDDATRRQILSLVRRTALDPGLHPDTRLSASQVWMKLKAMDRAKDLGPGKPLTHAAARERLVALLRAVGPELSIEAISIAFNLTPKGVSREEADSGPAPQGAPEALGEADNGTDVQATQG